MTFRFKKTNSINMNQKMKMLKLKIMALTMIQMMSFSAMRRLEISAILIAASWISGISAMEMESF